MRGIVLVLVLLACAVEGNPIREATIELTRECSQLCPKGFALDFGNPQDPCWCHKDIVK